MQITIFSYGLIKTFRVQILISGWYVMAAALTVMFGAISSRLMCFMRLSFWVAMFCFSNYYWTVCENYFGEKLLIISTYMVLDSWWNVRNIAIFVSWKKYKWLYLLVHNLLQYGLPMPIALLRADNNLPPWRSGLKEVLSLFWVQVAHVNASLFRVPLHVQA